MGQSCITDIRDQGKDTSRIPLAYKPLKISPTEESGNHFGKSILTNYIKIGPTVLESLNKYGLYTFAHSVADLRGTEDLPVKQATSDKLTYVGQMLGSKLHGKGHMVNSDGDLYVCPFHEGQPQGEGAVYFANGNYFFGLLVTGDLADGKMIYKDGTIYVGQFLNANRHGTGTHSYANGSKYEGQWTNDKENGFGKLIIPGIWQDGQQVSSLKPSQIEATPRAKSVLDSPSSKVSQSQKQPLVHLKVKQVDNPTENSVHSRESRDNVD